MTMKKTCLLVLLSTLLFACKNEDKSPDVSGIKIDLETNRFDQDFFGIDTANLSQGLSTLQQKYPEFLSIYLQNIVAVDDETGVRSFMRFYKPVFDSAQLLYKNFEPIRAEIEKGLQYTKYYFPNYKTPIRVIPIIGPMNGREDMPKMGNGEYTPDFIGPDLVGVSLQFYLGRHFSLYQQEYFINNVAPLFRSRRFSKEYIVSDVMKLIVDDLFPDKSNTLPLVEQMIERGKQWWLLDRLLPSQADSVKTGYTQQQLDWCNKNEGMIWSELVKNEDLRALDPPTIQNYLGEAPFTQGFSQELSPGNIGSWIGWQIVKKYASAKSSATPEQVMKASAKEILEEAKYKPK